MKQVIKNILSVSAFLLLAAGAAQPINAAEPAAEKPVLTYPGGQVIVVGDTVRINPDTLHYLTGERIAKWVYKKQLTVQQVGGRRYPYGILLRGIYSWVYPPTIYPVTPKMPKTDTITVSACGEYYWYATDTTYTQSGEYVFKGKAANGCDSTAVLFLTINTIPNTIINKIACEEYTWEATGETYTTSGDYIYKATAANGCDSIVTLHLTIKQPTHRKTTVEIRPRQLPYEWNGIIMENIGDTSRIAGTDSYGCDLIEDLELKFKAQTRYGKPITPVVPGWSINVPYHIDRFAVGARAGFASNFAGEKLPLGAGAMLDFTFAHYWVAGAEKTAFGLKTGLNLGYVYTTQSKTPDMDKFAVTADGGKIDYEISTGEVKQNTHQLQLEVPIMFAMQTHRGFFLNAGPKLILPVYSQYKQTLDPTIKAYLPELNGNPIVNEVVTGKAESVYKNKFLVDNPCKLFSLALGAELGYNIKLRKYGQSIDLGVYADYSIINAYKNTADPVNKVITVTPPSSSSAAIVDVHPLSTAYSNEFGFMNVGLKVAFNFDTNYFFN